MGDYSASFFVVGRPAPKGSGRAVMLPARQGQPGSVRLADGRWMRPAVIHANERTKPWQRAVAVAASAHAPETPLDGPIYCSTRFLFERPKSTKYPLAPAGTPDLDKLERCVWDALTAVIWSDDARVCRGSSEKAWGETEGVDVLVYEIDEGEGAPTDTIAPTAEGAIA
jgi:Holliday junction resolvase RusA-like endonuclease